MKLSLASASLLMACSCGLWEDEDNKAHQPTAQECLAKVQPVRDTYLSLLPTIADEEGWYETRECDALLWNSLLASGGVPIEITKARAEADPDNNPSGNPDAGKWFRRPSKDCYSSGGSKSEISRDMYMGLLTYATLDENLPILQGVYDFGKANDWIMGDGALARTVMTPGLQGTLADAIVSLGGDKYPEHEFPQVWSTVNTGYQAHLDVLHILLRGHIVGGISDTMAEVLDAQYNRDKNNPLFSFAWHKYNDGDYVETLNTLNNSALWPTDRLPTSENYCDTWPIQRDPGHNWEPCPEKEHTYTGGGLIFVTRLIERELGQ